jgi:DNA repair protein RadC
LLGARSFIVAHNHPDGACEMSTADLGNERLFEALADLLGIEFDGSFILTRGGWCKIPENEIHYWY